MKESDSYHNKTSESNEQPTGWEELTTLDGGQEISWENLATPEPTPSLPDLPRTSKNRTCGFYLREIEHLGRMGDVKEFLDSALSREYQNFASDPEALDQFCETYSDQLSAILSPEAKDALKRYSGLDYKVINQVARGQWNYEILGRQTPEELARAKQSIDNLSQAISATPALGTNLIAHRGTNLDTFQSYQVHSISDLASLKNQFFLESGFTSTSLDRSRSFADRADFDDPLRRACNITIEYLIPAENNEAAGLFSSETSYSPNQREVLIDQGSLSYVSDVKISPDQTSAVLQMALIPREIYDPASAKA